MEKRKLTDEISVAPLAFGGNIFGWTADEATSFRLLDAFASEGFNLVDTADIYSRWATGHQGGESETIIGRWLKQSGRRSEVIVATKAGGDMGQGVCVRKDYILQAAEASLRRLQTDYIDLYQTHFDDEQTPVAETLEAYAQLIREGKVRAIGTSNMSPARIRESMAYCKSHGLPHYQALQPEYNLYIREKFEQQYLPLCEEFGLGVLNYFALASGFLSGKYRSEADAHKSPRGMGIVQAYLNHRGRRILGALDEVASRYGARPATVALAWLVAKPYITAPIASATTPGQLREITAAVRLKLDEDSVKLLDAASAPH